MKNYKQEKNDRNRLNTKIRLWKIMEIVCCFVLLSSTFVIADGPNWGVNKPIFNGQDGVLVGEPGNNQYFPQIISDGEGGAITTWEDRYKRWKIFSQKINSRGEIQWTPKGVAVCTGNDDQSLPQIVSDGAGGAIIAWLEIEQSQYSIYAQKINSSGETQWTPKEVASFSTLQLSKYLQIISDGAGGAIVFWIDNGGGRWPTIYTQRINANGAIEWAAKGVAVSKNIESIPQIISDGFGGAIMTWVKNEDIYAQKINSSGVVEWTPKGVAVCTADDEQTFPQIVSDGEGGAIIAWKDNRNARNMVTRNLKVSPSDIYAQKINKNGVVQWKADGTEVIINDSYIYPLQIVRDRDGGAIIAWKNENGTRMQKISSSGAFQWRPDGIDCCNNKTTTAQVISDREGGAIIAWEDEKGSVSIQKIDKNGWGQWQGAVVGNKKAKNRQYFPQIISDEAGGAIVAWVNADPSCVLVQRIATTLQIPTSEYPMKK